MAALLLTAALGGCATTVARAPSCPVGQDYLHTAKLFLGQSAQGQPRVNEAEFRKFVDVELTPRFPNGLTVVDGGARWPAGEDPLIRQAQKVVLIVLPGQGQASRRIDAVRTAYRARFHQDSVLKIDQPACVSF